MDPAGPVQIAGRPVPILSAGAENVMAAAAIVSLAAYFESFVRAQIEEYARGVVSHFANLHVESQVQIVDVYWKSSVLGLGRLKPKDDPHWATKAASSLNGLSKFPISSDSAFADPTRLSDHENNMRFEIISQISKRVGINNLGKGLYGHRPLRSYIGAPNETEFLAACKSRLFEFQDLRNQLVHQISQASGVGNSVYIRHRDFISLFSIAYTSLLVSKYPVFEARAINGNAKLTA